MEKVLVTGGAGFIGSNLCESLLNSGYQIICFDNLITGSDKNIEHLISDPKFEFVEGDVCKKSDLAFIESKIDYIFNLASPASPIDYQKFPEETLLTNTLGTLNLLNLARANQSKFLLASTSEVYGDPLVHPQKETYFGNVNSFGPRSCYDESKRLAESASYVFHHKYDLDLRIIRIFNTYGPKMQKDDGRVVSNFINWAINDEQLLIDGDGSQTRSFCYVSDLVEGIKKAMFTKGTKGEIINLGNPIEFTIKDLANEVVNLTGSNSEITYSREFRQDDPMRRRPDIAKANELLDWEPKINLTRGLKETIEFFKNY